MKDMTNRERWHLGVTAGVALVATVLTGFSTMFDATPYVQTLFVIQIANAGIYFAGRHHETADSKESRTSGL